MICPTCGTTNSDEALFCKYCGFDLSKAPRPAPAAPTPAAPAAPPAPFAPPAAVVPRPAPVRTWWHGIGVFAIVAIALLVLDLGANGRVTWSFVGILSAAFIVGGVMILQFLAVADRRDRRPFVAGAVLLIAAVLLLPVAVALQSTATFTDTYTVPARAGISSLDLSVSDDVGHVTVGFASNPGYLLQAQVTHLGGLFSSHYPGDVVVSNATNGNEVAFSVAAKGVQGLFFLGGHDIVVTVSAGVAVGMRLASTTGDIDVVVPEGVVVSGAGIFANVTTGSVHLTATNAVYAAGASLQGRSTTGSVSLGITQTVAHAGTVAIVGTSTTGTVTFTFTRGNGVAAQVSSAVTTGSVNPDPSKYTGASNALLYAPDASTYGTATMQFTVTLASTTGSIDLR
ncbi:MAG TPA: zinc ribbon domain-containing protein [Thermoplasmata archaeon]|nr:zinc ribbon domain-containing protein [Thermoplasmata archaeon]